MKLKAIRDNINNIIGLIGLISLIGPIITTAGCSAEPREFNVVFITMDTTRGDYVDTGKGAKAYTPELKRFAQKAVVFERAYCAIPQTLPSHLTILTSYFPHEINVYSNEFKYDGRYEMIQERLKQRGYRTAGIVSLGTLAGDTGINRGFDEFNENLNDGKVFFTTAQKVTDEALRVLEKIKRERFFLFLHYSDPHSPYAPPTANGIFTVYLDEKPVLSFNAHQGSILRNTTALSPGTHRIRFRVETHEEDFDAFVLRRLKFSDNCKVDFQNIVYSKSHYNGSHILKSRDGRVEGEVHVTCDTEGSMKLFQVIPLLTWKAAIDYYRQEVEYMDRHVGRFLKKLEQEDLLDDTVVVITADHGEGLGERERYFGHIRYLNRQFIEVPLLMHLPGIKSKRIAVPVSHTGISPTVLELLGAPDNEHTKLRSLLKLIKSGDVREKPVYSFAFKPSAVEDKLSVISGPYQCIYNKDDTGTAPREFYDYSLSQSFRRIDELSPAVLLRNSIKEFNFFQKAFHRWSGAFNNRYFAKMRRNEKDIERLKSLGYLQRN